MLEWPEYCANPTAKSNRDQAVTVPFKVRTEAFDLYHSGQHHGKLKQRKPYQIYASMALLLALPVFLYSSYQVIAAKKSPDQETTTNMADEIQSETAIQNQQTINGLPIPTITVNNDDIQIDQEEVQVTRLLPTILSTKYDWDRIAACLDSKQFGCVCYGQSSERLMIPLETCQLAAKHGWTQTKIRKTNSL